MNRMISLLIVAMLAAILPAQVTTLPNPVGPQQGTSIPADPMAMAKTCLATTEGPIPKTRNFTIRRNNSRRLPVFHPRNGQCVPRSVPCKFHGRIGFHVPGRSGALPTTICPPNSGGKNCLHVPVGGTGWLQIGTSANPRTVKCSDKDNKYTFDITVGTTTPKKHTWSLVCKKCV